MLESLYNTFGFFGSLGITFGLFILFILWVGGIAGIAWATDEDQKNIRIFFALLFPPYPLLWLFYDMYRQKKMMEG